MPASRKLKNTPEKKSPAAAPAGPARAERVRCTLMLAGMIAAVSIVTAIVHWPALSATALTFDDDQYVTQNKLVQKPSWAHAWQFLREVGYPSTVAGYYQPLTMISLMVDTTLGGRPDDLRPYHRTSLFLHAANAGLVALVLYLLFGRLWPAAVVGILFGIHPMTVETIPWLGERKTLLASFFALWSLVIYLRYARRGPRWLYIGVVLAYVLALMAKPTVTPLPAAMLLLDIWPLRRPLKKAILEKLPLFLIAGIFSWIAMHSQAATCGLQNVGEKRGLGYVTLVLAHNSVFYLSKLLWPAYLSSHYPLPDAMVPWHPMVLAGLTITPIIVVLMLVFRHRVPGLLVGWLVFVGILFPAMGAFGFNNVIASDKYAYLPLLGIAIALAWGLGELWPRLGAKRQDAATREQALGLSPRQAGLIGLIVLVAAGEVYATRTYLEKWQETESLYRHMLLGAPKAPSLHNDLGQDLSARGRFDEALHHLHFALENARLPRLRCVSHNNLGITYARQNRLDEAIAQFREAVALQNQLVMAYPDQRAELASARYNLGTALFLKGKTDEAFSEFSEVLKLTPDDAEAHIQVAQLLLIRGQRDEAVSHLRAALRIEPGNALAKTKLSELAGPAGQ